MLVALQAAGAKATLLAFSPVLCSRVGSGKPKPIALR